MSPEITITSEELRERVEDHIDRWIPDDVWNRAEPYARHKNEVNRQRHPEIDYYDNDYDGSVVRCESRDNRTERYAVGGGGDIRLVRQLSSNACVRGRNWVTDSRGIWVSGGCRAEFSVGGSIWRRVE